MLYYYCCYHCVVQEAASAAVLARVAEQDSQAAPDVKDHPGADTHSGSGSTTGKADEL